jgi:hypothetical protein
MAWDPHSAPSLSSLRSTKFTPSTPQQPFQRVLNRSPQDSPEKHGHPPSRRMEERNMAGQATRSHLVHRTPGEGSEHGRRDASGSNARREKHKERGSSQQAPFQSPNRRPDRSPMNTFMREEKKEKPRRKVHANKQAPLKVYIPSTVSVGNLATILKVRIGMGYVLSPAVRRLTVVSERLQRRIAGLGLTESPSYDYGPSRLFCDPYLLLQLWRV